MTDENDEILEKKKKFYDTLTRYFSEKSIPTGFYNAVGQIRDHVQTLNKNLETSNEIIKNLGERLSGLGEGLSKTNQVIHNEADALTKAQHEIANKQSWFNGLTIGLTAVIAAATLAYVWITYQSVQAVRESNKIQQEVLRMQQRAFSIEKRPYLYVNFLYDFRPREDDILFGAIMGFRNTGDFPANVINLKYLVADDDSNKPIDFKKWYGDTYGNFPDITVVPPGQDIMTVYTPGISKNATLACVGVLAQYAGEDPAGEFWFRRLDVFRIIHDETGKITDKKLIDIKIDWDRNQNRPLPEFTIPNWSAYRKANVEVKSLVPGETKGTRAP